MKQREGKFRKYFNNKENCSTNSMSLTSLFMVNPCSGFLAELIGAQISGGIWWIIDYWS